MRRPRKSVGQGRGDGVVRRAPDPSKGEYVGPRGRIKVCKACKPGGQTARHTCGLAGLQDMITIGRG